MLMFVFLTSCIKVWYISGLESKPIASYDYFTHYACSANFVLGNPLLSSPDMYKGCPCQTEMVCHMHEQHALVETSGNSDVWWFKMRQ